MNESTDILCEPPNKRPCSEFDSPNMNLVKTGKEMAISNSVDVEVQIFNDPVHGFIEVHPLLVEIIHTPQFERLKDIKQLGVCYWVFPGASHNRFEHCLGTAHLCGKLINTLRDLHQNEIEITEKESLCVKVAGLCHDLGHGPFSHFFDDFYIRRAKPGCKWKHEQASCDLFELLIDSNPSVARKLKEYDLGREEIDFIKELIQGKHPQKDTVERICPITGKPKWFLFEIVSNKRTGIDCDKFDYFARDCANVGVTSNFDYRRYFQNVRILPIDHQLQICVREKEVFNLYELFHTRWSLHHRVYQHKTQAPIQDLLLEAFLKVDKTLRISEAITDMKRFTVLTDSVMYDILRNESKEPNIIEAQELLQRIQRRELYKFCGQTQPGSENGSLSEGEIANELASISKKLASTLKRDLKVLTPEQVFVSIVNIHFGMKCNDPVDAVIFYNKSYQPLRVRKEQVSRILPQKFHEKYVRVYAKSREDSETIQLCFEAWCRQHGYPVPHMLQGDRSGYFSPAFKQNQSAINGGPSHDHVLPKGPRSLQKDFENC